MAAPSRVWSRQGREIFYRQDDRLMAVDITTTSALSAGTPRMLFRGIYRTGVFGLPGYDVSPDGKRFLMVAIDQNFPLSSRVNYVIGWTATLSSAR